MLGDISGITNIYCVTGVTDMRRSIDGLMAIIRDTYQMDPYARALYLFCGRRRNTLKALYFDRDGFCLLYKRPGCNRPLSVAQKYIRGTSIDQAGIPVADGRVIDRTAQGDPAGAEEKPGILICA